MAKQSILDVLKSASIPEMELELQELEGKLELATQQFKSDIEALKLSIKLASVAQNGKPEKKPRAKRGEKNAGKDAAAAPGASSSAARSTASREPTIADRAHEWLLENGEDTPIEIARGIKLEKTASIYPALASDQRIVNTGRGTYFARKP